MFDCVALKPSLIDAVLSGDILARSALADEAEEDGRSGDAEFWRRSASGDVARMGSMPEQLRVLLPSIRDYWISVGLRSGHTDRTAAEQSVDAVYHEAGLDPPQRMIWMTGPLHGAVAASMLAQVGDQVGAQVRTQVGAQVRTQVRTQVRDQVWTQVWAQVRDQVWTQVWTQVWAQVGAQVWAQVGAQVGAQVDRCGYGTHDSAWIAYHQCFDIAGLTAARRLCPLAELSRHVGWWWPFECAIILTDLPTSLVMRNGKLVSVEYADGLCVKRGTA